ncbi:MAG: FtsX-like permease family protein [Candidatus Odinarchaeota archaeon]
MVLRIFFKAWRISMRTTRRFIVFLIAYSILLTWIAFIVRLYYIELFTPPIDPAALAYYNLIIGWTLVAGTIMGMLFSWLMAHGRKDDIATLKCVGWSNHDIRELVLGEIIFITIAAVVAIALLGVIATGFYAATMIVISLDPLGNIIVVIPEALRYLLIRPDFMLIAFGAVMLVQVPGILILIWRTLRISPMRALTRPE